MKIYEIDVEYEGDTLNDSEIRLENMALMHVGEVTTLRQESVKYAFLGWVSTFNL